MKGFHAESINQGSGFIVRLEGKVVGVVTSDDAGWWEAFKPFEPTECGKSQLIGSFQSSVKAALAVVNAVKGGA